MLIANKVSQRPHRRLTYLIPRTSMPYQKQAVFKVMQAQAVAAMA
jgi:hypothetical protein